MPRTNRDHRGRFTKPNYRPVSIGQLLIKHHRLVVFLVGCILGSYAAWWIRWNLP